MEPLGVIIFCLVGWGAISGWLLKNSRAENAQLQAQHKHLWGKHQMALERLTPEYQNMLVSAKDICNKILADAKRDAKYQGTFTNALKERLLAEAKQQAERLIITTEAKLQKSRQELENNKREAERFHRQYCDETKAYGARLNAVEKMLQHPPASAALSWLAEQYAEFADWSLKEVEDQLKWSAGRAAETVSEIRGKRRQVEKQLRTYKARARYYEIMFPFLCDMVDDDSILIPQESMQDGRTSEAVVDDVVLRWLKTDEYNSKTEIERNQLALDRYTGRRKTNWELGRDYEAFIGHEYTKVGYFVEYVGMLKGLEDLGRDLICTKGTETLVVQCKRWAQGKLIHEKHINQLVGTTIEYAQKNAGTLKLGPVCMRFSDGLFNHDIRPVFVTTTQLSETAKRFATSLGVEVRECERSGEYPAIKCNISRIDNRKIYHLPFDEQYDTTIIEPEKGEFFAYTVKEAADKGFVRAKRYFSFGTRT